ncbi:hypothetical protein BCR37DRAFT_388681 [Protomyces lactucae-debilis]|uniref:Extracellular membrane protein CFEM domain-containing protein n=1 Tax=Protomyces lactucae-debilis TaxID=2754530 RepID=A0A1Y2F6H6_PROLT|nr:uncharacterized protein BCR37DRAFT_388681 [Protomyces lactucae-debilis]ORY79084.1 hypothetical protein BCR37DRAFT_388681 [Protomyces lactucae-debilis]
MAAYGRSGRCSLLVLLFLLLLYIPQLSSMRSSGSSQLQPTAKKQKIQKDGAQRASLSTDITPDMCYMGRFPYWIRAADPTLLPISQKACLDSCVLWSHQLASTLKQLLIRGRSKTNCIQTTKFCFAQSQPKIFSVNVCEHTSFTCEKPQTLHVCSCKINVDLMKVFDKRRCDLATMHDKILDRLKGAFALNPAMVIMKDKLSSPQELSKFSCTSAIGQCLPCTLSSDGVWQPCFSEPPNQACVEQEGLESMRCYPFPWMSANERMALSNLDLYQNLVLAFGQKTIDRFYSHNAWKIPPEAESS